MTIGELIDKVISEHHCIDSCFCMVEFFYGNSSCCYPIQSLVILKETVVRRISCIIIEEESSKLTYSIVKGGDSV